MVGGFSGNAWECIPFQESWRPRSSGGSTWHLPQRAVTLTRIVYWPGDPAIPYRGVTARVTAFITRGVVTGNTLYVCICFLHCIWIQFQPWWWLCNPESMLPHYMIWLSSDTIFWCDFNRDGYYIIRRLLCHIIWYGHHLASFFNVISTMIVTT
jgi:hypothetical protein